MKNYDFLLSIYESEELSDMEKMGLISIMEDANSEYDKLQKKIHNKRLVGAAVGGVRNVSAAVFWSSYSWYTRTG